jgi:hypothetical protein
VFAGGATLGGRRDGLQGEGLDPSAVFELLAGLVVRSLLIAEEHGPKTRYRLLETIRQYAQERLDQAGETGRWQARHAGYYAGILRQVRDHAHDPNLEGFWPVPLSADQDNLLAAWSWAIGTGNVGTAFPSWPASRRLRSPPTTRCCSLAGRPSRTWLTPPSCSASPRCVTCSPVTRQGRSRWPVKHLRWLAGPAPRPSSRPASPIKILRW